MLKYIGVKEVKQIAIGATLLGSGGGGDPFIGELMVINAIKKFGKIKLISTNEIKDNQRFVAIANVGAPSIGAEKFSKGDEYKRAFQAIEKYTHKKFNGVFAIEVGGGNSLVPMIVATELHIPMIDCDAIGRALPGVNQTTFAINGVKSFPMFITDEKGNSVLINNISSHIWIEKLARAITNEMGGTSTSSSYIATGKQIKDYAVHGDISLCQKIGQLIQHVPYSHSNNLKKLLKLTNGIHLFDGKVTDISHKVKKGFNFGKITLKGISHFNKQSFTLNYQNENLIAKRNNKVVGCVPDLICFTDFDTLMPSTSETIKYGKRVSVIGIPCSKKWRTPQGLKCVNPKVFGYDFNYKPIENLNHKGA